MRKLNTKSSVATKGRSQNYVVENQFQNEKKRISPDPGCFKDVVFRHKRSKLHWDDELGNIGLDCVDNPHRLNGFNSYGNHGPKNGKSFEDEALVESNAPMDLEPVLLGSSISLHLTRDKDGTYERFNKRIWSDITLDLGLSNCCKFSGLVLDVVLLLMRSLIEPWKILNRLPFPHPLVMVFRFKDPIMDPLSSQPKPVKHLLQDPLNWNPSLPISQNSLTLLLTHGLDH
ncbi:hypothetical protein LIER_43512 [Lithospermum erythrorhizon]|uniref:Uncharacterized protein n=1 Tax=Lithospermum erythrorhizon TaxID=34254 RepID=A0AAV3QC03_LITER